jgi:hypothetical protein
MFFWVRRLRCFFRQNDRIQMVVGTAEPMRQLLKGWIPANRIRNADPLKLGDSGGGMAEIHLPPLT